MRRNSMIALMCLSAIAAQAQQNGGIDASMLETISQQQPMSVAEKAISNALATNSIDNLAKNFANSQEVEPIFTIETPKQSITDQKSSGRCWMFSGLNVLRSKFTNESTLPIDFSHDYLFFWDQLEKANLFLQGIIDTADKPIDDQRVQFFFKSPLSDGGTFCGVADLADKYGLVPKSVMPETYSAENTARFRTLLNSKLREMGLRLRDMSNGKEKKNVQKEKTQMLKDVYRLLCLAYGEPPKTFTYAFKDKNGKKGETKTYTPQSFYAETVGGKINGSFIMVMNDPRRPYHKTYEVEYDRHTYDGHNWKYLNLPMEEIAQLAIASLKDGRKLYSSYDVGKQLDRTRGYCDLANYDYATLLGTTFNMDKAQRISTFDSGSTHAMTLTAVDLDSEGKPTRWKVENSWGATSGHHGYIVMSNRWFEEYMFRLVVDNKYVPEQLMKEFEQKPLMVMPEDPLFQEDK